MNYIFCIEKILQIDGNKNFKETNKKISKIQFFYYMSILNHY